MFIFFKPSKVSKIKLTRCSFGTACSVEHIVVSAEGGV